MGGWRLVGGAREAGSARGGDACMVATRGARWNGCCLLLLDRGISLKSLYCPAATCRPTHPMDARQAPCVRVSARRCGWMGHYLGRRGQI